VSCLGSGLENYWAGLMRAHNLPVSVRDPHANMPNRLLYAVADDAPPWSRGGAVLGRTSSFAVRAARSALSDAGLVADTGPTAGLARPGRLGARPDGAGDIGVSIGTGVGDASIFEQAHRDGAEPTGPDAFPFKVSSVLATEFGLAGPMTTVSTACSASAYSVSLAADTIRDGQADVMLAGGADGYTRVGVACFNRMGALDPVRCRPFDRDRQGTVFGEGAAMMVLESQSHARARGCTRWYATVDGAGWSCDAHHATAPEPKATQIVRAMGGALTEAGLSAADIDCVLPHGTGTPLNDAIEGRALRETFGDSLDTVALYSLKALLGHTGGAAGAFGLLTAMLIIHFGVVPPNAAVWPADAEHGLHPHTGAALTTPVRHALVNAYAFGGNNISVVVARA
jgi:3-oxoacyl-(acyl-carrier-protein) synthase